MGNPQQLRARRAPSCTPLGCSPAPPAARHPLVASACRWAHPLRRLLLQEVVEASAEEASKKLNLNLHDKVGAGPPKQVPPSPAELDAFGITPDFAEFVRTINYR